MRLLQIELTKLPRRSNYVLFVILMVLFVLSAYIRFKFLVSPNIDATIAGIDSGHLQFISTILTIFMMMNTGQEYTENTLRRSVIEGYTRPEFYIGKLVLLFTATIFLLVLQKSILLIAAALQGNITEALHYLTAGTIAASFFNIIFYGLFGLFLIFVTRSIAISIVIYFVWGALEAIIHAVLQFKYPTLEWSSYLPFSSLSKLMAATGSEFFTLMLVPVAYLLVMTLSSLGLFLKRDIK